MQREINYQKGAVGVVIGVIIAVIVIGGVIWAASSSGDSAGEAMMEGDTVMKDEAIAKDDVMTAGNEMMKKDDTMMSDETSMMRKGGYEAYSSEKLAFAESGNVVLFFYASWCPYCRTADADIMKNVANIPADLLILKTDYDKETALKQKYGVTYQHTFVQVDAQGNQIAKWSGSETLADIRAMVK